MLHLWVLFLNIQEEAVSLKQLALLTYVILAMLLFAIVFITFFSVFQKRKNKMLLDQIEQQRLFDEELIKTQQEIQDETLKHVGRELHDNVGQLLTVATMQMNA